MDNVLLQEYIIPFKGIKKKIIYHFSDSHLTTFDEISDSTEIEKAVKATSAWEGVRKGFCEAYGKPYGEFEKQSPEKHFYNLLTEAKQGDALVLAGDTLDYISGSNVRLFESVFENYKIPYIAVCGNHEPISKIPDGFIFSKVKQPIQKLDLGDMVIIGIDNSARTITGEQLEIIRHELANGIPALIVMHVPIMTEGNKARLEKSGVYFQLNYEGCPKENLEFIELLRTNSDKVIAVLAGHLHYSDESEISDGLMQYVSSQGITGNINRYIIGE